MLEIFHLKSCLITIAICGLSCYCVAQNTNAAKTLDVIFNGNTFETHPSDKTDTLVMTDPLTGSEIYKTVSFPPEPIRMNGKKIWEIDELIEAPFNDRIALLLEKFILSYIKNDTTLQSYNNGTFKLNLRDIIVDEQGRIVYYEPLSLLYKDTDGVVHPLNADYLERAMTLAPKVKPVLKDGTPVIARLNTGITYYYKITVADHEISYKKEKGICKM
ncbi:MAG: hypothetical protein JWQ38_137 [Flavipsychrobacter sp.]|nr:hypothetical protein [Flavipsychrobacter sp.]